MTTGKGLALAAVAAMGMLALPERAQAAGDAEFSLGVGYSRVSLDGSAAPFDDRDGVRVEPRFSFGVSDQLPPLRLGFAVGVSGFSRELDGDSTVIIDDDDDDIIVIGLDDVEALSLITPEVQLSWRHTFGGGGEVDFNDRPVTRGFFIEPGVGLGVVIGNYWLGDEWGWDEEISEWDATIAARPFLRGGYQWRRFTLGAEASYLFGGSLDLTDSINGSVEEFYAGVFFGGRW